MLVLSLVQLINLCVYVGKGDSVPDDIVFFKEFGGEARELLIYIGLA